MPHMIDGKSMDPYCPKCSRKIVAYCGPREMSCDWCGWQGYPVSIDWRPVPMRKECKWCIPPRPVDGKGPILEGEEVTHTICDECRHEQRARL